MNAITTITSTLLTVFLSIITSIAMVEIALAKRVGRKSDQELLARLQDH